MRRRHRREGEARRKGRLKARGERPSVWNLGRLLVGGERGWNVGEERVVVDCGLGSPVECRVDCGRRVSYTRW